MYPRSSSLRNKRSEDQLISELIDVFKRHNINCGDPQDLAHLGVDLVSNDDFRNDLFSRCNVINHMSKTGLSPEQLLVITAQALGGPGIANPDGTVDVPPIVRSAFLIGYEIWTKEGDEEEANQSSVARQPSVASRLAPEHRADTRENGSSSNGSAADLHYAGPISPSTSLDNLTLNQLKGYIEDIERRINRIEPHLGQASPRSSASVDVVTRLNSFESQNGHAPEQMMPNPAAGAASEHGLNSAFGLESLQSRGVVQRKVLPSIGPLAAPPPAPLVAAAATAATAPFQSTPSTAAATSPIDRLHVAIATLSFLLILTIASTAIFAYRNLHPEDTSTRTADSSQITGLSTQPGAQPSPFSSAATPLDPIAPSRSASPASTPGSVPAKPAPVNTIDKRAAAPTPQAPAPAPANRAAAAPSAPQPQPPARSQPQQPAPAPVQAAQAPQTAVTPPANPTPAPAAPAPVTQAPPPVTVAASTPPPVQPREEPRATPPPAATTPAAAPKPAETPAPAPVSRTAPPPTGPVSVPSATMLRYAITMPPPAYPKNRFSRPDDSVLIEATISPNGSVTGLRTISGPPDLRGVVTQAMQGWRFKPYIVDGNPVQVVTTFNFAFKPK